MARHPVRRREILRAAAKLFEGGTVHTGTTQYKLVRAIVEYEGGPSEDVISTTQVIKRTYTTPRLPELWQDVLKCSKLPKGDEDHVGLSDQAASRLGLELVAAAKRHSLDLLAEDPKFAQFNAELDEAGRAPLWDTRLRGIMVALNTFAQVAGSVLRDTPADDALRQRKASAASAEVFDAVLAGGDWSTDAIRLAEQAIEAGHRCLPPAKEERPVTSVGDLRDLEGLRWSRSGQWVIAAAVLQVMAGVPVNQVVHATRKWATERLGVDGDLDPVELLTEAAWRLLLNGRRDEATGVSLEAWRVTGTQAPSELLQLSLHIAGVLYSHGDVTAAGRALPLKMREVLKRESPNHDPDYTWGDEISSWFYRSLLQALSDPSSVVEQFRMEWLNALRHESMSTGYPSKWVLAGTFVEVLVQDGDLASAATVAQVSGHALEKPADVSELHIRSHLAQMSDGHRPDHAPLAAGQVEELVGDLARMVVSGSATLDYPACGALEGLLLVTKFQRGDHVGIADRPRMKAPNAGR